MARIAHLLDPEKVAMLREVAKSTGQQHVAESIIERNAAEVLNKHEKARATVGAIRRPTVVKHRPRMTDGREHPVDVRTIASTNLKENTPVSIDINTISDADLGAAVKANLRRGKAVDLPAKNKKAKKEKAKAAKVEVVAKVKERKDRNVVLPEIVVSERITIPALDVSDFGSLDEVVSAKLRSPYNKARFSVVGPKEALPSGKEVGDGATTVQDLANEHQRIAGVLAGKVADKADKVKTPKKRTALAAHVPMDEDTKIATLMKTFDVNKKTAKRMLAEIGA